MGIPSLLKPTISGQSLGSELLVIFFYFNLYYYSPPLEYYIQHAMILLVPPTNDCDQTIPSVFTHDVP